MFGGSYEKKDVTFDPLPKGRYQAILDNVCIEETPTNKSKYLKMDFTVIEGKFKNRKIFHKLWFTEKAYDMAAQQLDNIMIFGMLKPCETIEGFMNAAATNVFELCGKKFEVSVTGYDEHDGKKYENTFLTHFLDVPNAAIQKASDMQATTTPAKPQPKDHSGGNTNPELGF
jgi:hypothetical protein